MIIPEEVLQKQLCSSCSKYLSVGPVKVYPNRQVKCGRCVEKNDGGTESLLYKTMANCLLFPCINRFNGCKEVLSLAEMKYHENTCKEITSKCPLCEKYEGPAYYLNAHLQAYHRRDTLDANEFLINLEKGYQEKIYFYGNNISLHFIYFEYNVIVQRLKLGAAIPTGYCYQGNETVKFTLYNIDNEVLHTIKIPYLINDESDDREKLDSGIDLSSLKILQNIVICKFFIKEEPLLTLQQRAQIIDALSDGAIIRCRFDAIWAYLYKDDDSDNDIDIDHDSDNDSDKYSLNDSDNDDDYHEFYPKKFVVNGVTFEVHMKICEEGMIFFLDQRRLENKQECHVYAKFTIVSSHSKVLFVTNKGEFSNKTGKMYLDGLFDKTKLHLLKPDKGFVENDFFVVEILCQVQLNKKPSCLYCDSCKRCKIK